MAYLQECLQRFENLPTELKERFGSLEAFEKIEKIENNYGIDLKFLVILLAIGEINISDVPAYLMEKYDLAEEDAYEIRDELLNNMFSFIIFKEKSVGDDVLPLEEVISKDKIVNIFKQGLLYFLQEQGVAENEINSLNESIFFHLSADGSWQEVLSKALFDNDEQITAKALILENREVAPTIANWLKDFFKVHGAEIFNDLILLQYLNSSANAKNLSTTEKVILRKMLKTYYNLNFFPESVENLAIDDWQIIPVISSEEDSPISEKTNVAETATEEIKPAAIPKTTLDGQRLVELKEALGNYPATSLEYKALNQEITRLERKIKIN